MSRNREQWMSVADFLTLENLRIVLRKRVHSQQLQGALFSHAAGIDAAEQAKRSAAARTAA